MMTGIFDFVRDIVDFAIEEGFLDLVENVLTTALQNNKNKKFLNWIEEKNHNYMNYDFDELEEFFSDFHSLDHFYHHRVWSDTAHSILYQFSRMFMMMRPITRDPFVFEQSFRTLRKHVPDILKYMKEHYKPRKHGAYQLKKGDES